MARIFEISAGRRTKFVIAVVWLIAAAAAGSVSSKFQSAQKNDPASYLPGSAESSRALAAVKTISGGAEVTPTVVVFHREGGLTPADLASITGGREKLNSTLPADTVPARPPAVSADHSTALLSFGLRLHADNKALTNQVGAIRSVVHGNAPPGLEVKVTGPGGASYDAAKVFGNINGTLLEVTVAFIFILLVIIYRSPIFWIIPLVSVGMAEVLSEGLGYALTQAGVNINGQSAGVLTVLVFGAGTDYALLLVARYREELRTHEDAHTAMRVALRRAGPVIFASAMTVITALLTLVFAQVNGTRGLGPIGAMGVFLAMLSGLTLLPALLLIAGRRAFWPYVPRFGTEGSDETHGLWRRIADNVARHHRIVGAAVTVLLLVLCLGLLTYNTNATQGNSFRAEVESQQGQKLLAAHFPAGASAPAQVVVPDPAKVPAVQAAVAKLPEVAQTPGAVGAAQVGAGGAVFNVVLRADPSSRQAFNDITPLRAAAKAAGGPDTLVGGPSAQERDFRAAAARDNKVIVPLVLIVVFVILSLLLRALVAPALLVLTVLLSYGAALGFGVFFSNDVFGFPGEDPTVLLFTFIFLVALGVDYNIFLMARVREETLEVGTHLGVIRALAVTGAVITSAGIVLAGTFSALASLPLVTLTELGFIIAFGVLLDTFLVRTILVPALVLELDKRVWWPSGLAKRTIEPPADEQRKPEPEPASA